MAQDFTRLACIALVAVIGIRSAAAAERPEFGAKIGTNTSQVDAVSDFYATELRPANPINARSGAGLIVGGFVMVPITGRLGLEGEVLFSQQRHHVDVPPTALCSSCALRATFTRAYLDAAVLPKCDFVRGRRISFYAMAGPVFSFMTHADFETDDPTIRRGDPYRDIYYVTTLPYGTAELLKSNLVSIVVAGGTVIRRLSVEVRFSRSLQPIFSDRSTMLDALVKLGGSRSNLDRFYLTEVAPILDRAKSRNVSILLGFRF